MRSTLGRILGAYLSVGALLASILWASCMWPYTWGAPAHYTLARQIRGIVSNQPTAIFAAVVRMFLWGPSLASWAYDARGMPLGMWFAPGLYQATAPERTS